MKILLEQENRFRITFNWSDSLSIRINMPDVSPHDQFLRVYAVGLNQGKLPDARSLLYYNNMSNKNQSLSGDYGYSYYEYIGHDRHIDVKLDQLNPIYDRVLFIVGRPKAEHSEEEIWINEKLVEGAKNERSKVVCKINGKSVIEDTNFYYNQFGAITLFELCKSNDIWELKKNDQTYKGGLNEIIDEYGKHLL